MPAVELYVNDKKICTAFVEAGTASINPAMIMGSFMITNERHPQLGIVGSMSLNATGGFELEERSQSPRIELKMGDVVTFKILESGESTLVRKVRTEVERDGYVWDCWRDATPPDENPPPEPGV